MPLIDPGTTCLSPAVHYIICEAGFEIKSNYAVDSIVANNGEIYWNIITENLKYGNPGQSVNYIESVRSLGPLCESVHVHLQSLTLKQFEERFGTWCQWTNCAEIFLEMFDALKKADSTAIVLSLMKLASCLERALGDVFLLIGRDCPFLLRDLLASHDLATVFGRSAISYFSDLNNELISLAEEVVIRSDIVLQPLLPFWDAALTSFRQHRYADCVTLLLPQLESGLRLLFTTVNKCPSRLVTAESSSLYTTFDEMLAKQLNNEELNQLPLILGESAMEFLWDFLNHQEGPRVRDHLSHGEISLNDFPREIANSILAFSITLLCRFSNYNIAATKEYTYLKPLVTCANSYCSRFHPIVILKKQVLKCMKNIHLWSDLPVVPEEQVPEMDGSEKDSSSIPCIFETSGIFSLLQPFLPQNIQVLSEPLNNLLTKKLLTELCNNRICVLFCSRSVLEMVVVLRQISTRCHQVSHQVISTSETRYKQWINKSLRSRQRHNYLRMRRSITFLSPVLQLILILITLELINIHTVCAKNLSEYQQYLKFLKLILQYTENLVTYTSPEKNKWNEIMELSHKALIKIRTFFEKQQTLMQLAK